MLIQNVWHELLNRHGDWLLDQTRDAVEWREELIRRARLQNLAFFSDMCREAKRERVVLAEKYAKFLASDLGLRSEVSTEYDIREVLKLALSPGQGEEHRRQRFEAMSLFDQGCLLGAIDTSDSYRSISEDLRRLLSELNVRLFADRSRHVPFQLAIDPADSYRVKRIAIDGEIGDAAGLIVREETRFCRELKGGSFVYVDDRPKTPYETYLKTIRRAKGNEGDPFQVADKCGLKLVVPTVDDAVRMSHRLGDLLSSTNRGTILASADNLNGDSAVDPSNPHSSPRFRAIKILVRWDGRMYEIQIPSFQDYFSSLYATDKENHALYKLGKCLDVYFPILFPSEIYGFPWDDPGLREDLENDQRDHLERFARRKRRF